MNEKQRHRFLPALAAAFALSACVTTGEVEPLAPGEKPAIDTDEAGLWLQSEKAEKAIRESGRVVTDPELNAYVKDIVCKLEPEYCKDIRLYIVNTPGMNAFMSPSGAMFVWTGTLLRFENEAQLAHLLGHELAHYRLRHRLKKWREMRATSDGLAFFTVATAGVGLFPLTIAGGLAAADSLSSFSRETEREADDIGFERMVAAGYDPQEVVRFWEMTVNEEAESNRVAPSVFFSTHPQSDERQEAIRKRIEELGELSDSLVVGREQYIAQTSRFRRAWLEQEVKYSDFGRSLVVIEQLLEKDPEAGDLYFAKGEILWRRDEEGDLESAADAYAEAVSRVDYPLQAHRSLGLVFWELERKGEAASAFETYLAVSPDADDHLIIRSYIDQLK